MEKSIQGAFHKADSKHSLAIGFAIVSQIDGQPYYDLQDDHIPESVMLDAAVDFAKSDRPAKVMHQGDPIGSVIFMMPVTADIAKSLGVQTALTGLVIGVQVSDKSVFERIENGELKGFSIAGSGVRQNA